ncbi:uracil-DNA glycosylase [Haloplanus halophilus]|uniref:uracil-DNA glycosylase n=1 Tax=Haloplanus halophilus TaxID=2949993 RepID=UPI00203E2952|nr:uracil-DNA glycosylase [Haloplanus sp. GDY1]
MVESDGPDVSACERCPALVESRSRIVNGVGPEDAALLFVGEAPGADEDAQGEPFVGRSGSVLDDALRDAGLARADVRITNCVRCRPPENRDPHVAELDNCAGFLEREIEFVDPDLIVTLGKVPGERLLDRDVAVTAESGSVVDARLGGASRRVLLCLHPAATLYDRSQRGAFEAAVAKAADLVGATDGGEGGQSRLGDYR